MGAVTNTERSEIHHFLDNADSNLFKAEFKAKVEQIGVGPTYDRAAFYTEVRTAREKASVDTALSSLWTTSLVDRAGSPTGNIETVDVNQFKDKIGTPVFVDIKERVVNAGLDRLADAHIDHFLTDNTARNSVEYIQALSVAHAEAVTPELSDRINNRVMDVINKKINGLKAQLDAGTLSEADIRAMMVPGGRYQNPQLQAAINKFLDDPARVEARKKEADKATIDADAATYKGELDTIGVTEGNVDFDDLTTSITGLPEFATLSAPIQEIVTAHMENKDAMIDHRREGETLKRDLNEAEVHEKSMERNRAYVSLVLRRLQWIGAGAIAGGAIALLIGGAGGDLTQLLGNIDWGTVALGAVPGGIAGNLIANYFDTQLATRHKEYTKARNDLHAQADEGFKITAEHQAKEGEALVAYTKIAALVESLTKGVDKDEAIKTFLKTSTVGTLEELLKT